MAGEDGGEEDPYAVLGVPRTASSDAIRRAYRQLAGATHPDRHSSAAMREAASAAFHRVQRAYELLGDERTRAVFDTYGLQGVRAGLQLSAQPNSQPPSWETLAQAQTKQKQRRMEAKLNSRGSYMLGFSGSLTLPIVRFVLRIGCDLAPFHPQPRGCLTRTVASGCITWL
jgi:curved DNA-binding protein CbpA